MDWTSDGSSVLGDGGLHVHGPHCHSHGPRSSAFSGGMMFGSAPEKSTMEQPKKRSHLDESGSWDIVKATQFGALDRCKELIEAGYDVRQPDKENVTLLHWAAINNRLELTKFYISKGAVVDQLGGDLNSTPLHWAIRQGHLQMVIQLMRYGADPSIADGEGYKALHLAILFQHMAIAAYLMAKGQEVDTPDCNGQTPLMLAAQKIIGPEPTHFLVRHEASVTAVDASNRNTPLHCAVLAGNVDAAHILLEAGASVDAQNSNGHTPLDLAHQVHSPLLIHMLNLVKQERAHSSSRCLRLAHTHKAFVQFVVCSALFGSIGAILDLDSESWLLKGILLACVIGVCNLVSRHTRSPEFQTVLPSSALVASVFWMLVTWFLWFLPESPGALVQILFTLNFTCLLYFYFRCCRTDPGVIRATEEQKKMNVLVLAEAGCLDPRVFCTSCMIKKPVRTYHCFICDSCVAKHDHHSIWTNNCIGARNHHLFVLFLLSMSLMGVWMFYGAVLFWRSHCSSLPSEARPWALISGCVFSSPWVSSILLLSVYHSCWSCVTLLVQLYQISFLGLTTSEIKSLGKLRQNMSLRQNPYNLGVVRNLASFFQLRCCGLFKASLVDWTQQTSLDQSLFGPSDMV
ncbi:putative palmitoyltransferase ZDHHC13 [Boleophthalmus pectinirostris]|uniref:putative palmitoyltransferase ZDHHC13 n=1 Tax=Boleophthalmus pectinirostris TaxID=150288 RepID=UPI002432F3FA|nr:putative palmitoyltransferase ZDHHC13 [Boleophthalmus pectinirostris]